MTTSGATGTAAVAAAVATGTIVTGVTGAVAGGGEPVFAMAHQ